MDRDELKDEIREEIKEDVEEIKEDVEEIIQQEKEKIKQAKVRFASKMSSKITYLMIAAILVPIILLIIVSVRRTTDTMLSTYKSYAMNLAQEAVNGMDYAVVLGERTYGTYARDIAEESTFTINLLSGGSGRLSNDEMANAIGKVGITGVEGSYAYAVDSDGIFKYHPDSSKIGQPVVNDAVNGLVAEMKAGTLEGQGYIIYEYEGEKKLAGYAVTSAQDIIVVCANYDRFMNIDYDTLIGKMSITGVEGSYAYMLSSDGTMMYHPDGSKVGQTIENETLMSIVSRIQNGEDIAAGSIVYVEDGVYKLAGYAITDQGNIIVVTGDYNKFIQPVTDLRNSMIIMGVVLLIVFVVAGIIVANRLLKAVELIVPVIQNTAQLDFTYNARLEKLSQRKDEMGVIAREVENMQVKLRDVVETITDASRNIDSNVDQLKAISDNVKELCTVNSATSETMAAAMEETAASTVNITGTVDEMERSARNIESMTINGANTSVAIMERATTLRSTAEQATRETMDIYNSVKEKSAASIEAATAVNRINELTNTVMEISTQTSLLSLNASIEAARAGEAGRGFAVVATEISHLAAQTANAVTDINGIIINVTDAVNNMTDCLEDTVNFLESKVLGDYDSFNKVSVQYQEDADTFKDTMEEIKSRILVLTGQLADVTESINAINVTMGESAEGVTDIASKSLEMVDESTITANKVNECKDDVANLNDIISRFTLD